MFGLLVFIDTLLILATMAGAVIASQYLDYAPIYIAVWVIQMGLLVAVLGGGMGLKARGRPGAAKLLLALPAVPAVAFGMLALVMLAVGGNPF